MNQMLHLLKRGLGRIRGGITAICLLLALSLSAQAQTASAIETAATTMIGDAKTAATNVLVAAIAILAAFVLYKLIRRAVNKA